jgi:uncharacterized membrane protein
MDMFTIAEAIGKILDLFGVLIIIGGIIGATGVFFSTFFEEKDKDASYKHYRKNLGRSILLGLELMVAGDIIRSVIGEPSFVSVGILGMIVLIRSFLGITFEMEIEGKWPWQQNKKSA